jgi:hypothetical protein
MQRKDIDNMSLNYIRSCYMVPAHLGGRVIAYGRFGTITDRIPVCPSESAATLDGNGWSLKYTFSALHYNTSTFLS